MNTVPVVSRALLLAGAVLIAPSAFAQPPRTSPAADPQIATQQYLASVPAQARERSDAYFEGGYWLQLWNFLFGSGVLLALLHTGWSRRMREAAARLTRYRPLQVAAYWMMFFAVTTVIAFPLTVYADFVREHQYGLSTQTFVAWSGDQLKGFGLGLLVGAFALTGLYGVLRAAPRTWWVWGAVFVILLQVVGNIVYPVFIAPIFNTYTRLEDPALREPILRMARANGLQATEVWQVDASRQSTRISANVSGVLGTERITLNDNLLKRCSPACVEAVMAHEIGHYVMNHIFDLLFALAVLVALGFAVAGWAFERLRVRYETRWGVTGIDDPAGLPLLVLILTSFLFVLTPVRNTIIRVNEAEADVFGLNAARQPDGFAEAALKVGEYRKLDPSPWEERLFYDHPSGRTRIYTAMRWKSEADAAPTTNGDRQ
jgi:STE24 endopeptidase